MCDGAGSSAGRENPQSTSAVDRDIAEAERLLLRMLENLDDPRMAAIVRQAVEILHSRCTVATSVVDAAAECALNAPPSAPSG
jgi:hypothetical protein